MVINRYTVKPGSGYAKSTTCPAHVVAERFPWCKYVSKLKKILEKVQNVSIAK